MKGASEILARLREEGVHDSLGRFTLDRRKAREKMGKFQLEDPHNYVLELVQSAVASGATKITAYCDTDDFRMEFDGEPFPREELENIFSSLFVSQQDFALERFRELALALNCAIGFAPSFVVVESGDGAAAWRLRIRGAHETMEEIPGSMQGTRIWVKDRISWRMMKRLLSRLKGLPIEGKILQERCRHAPVPVEVNGRPVNELRTYSGFPWKREFSHPECSGTLCLPQEISDISTVHVTRLGVDIATHTARLSSVQCEAYVQWDTCIKNVSQSDIVKDNAYGRVISLLGREAESLLEEMASPPDDEPPWQREWSRRYFLEYLKNKVTRESYTPRVKKIKRTIAGLPLFPLIDGTHVSLEELFAQQREIGFVPVLTGAVDTRDIPRGWRIVKGDGELLAALESIFRDKVSNVAAELEKEARRRRNRIHWDRTSYPSALSCPCLLRRAFSSPPFKGEVGIVEQGAPGASIVFVKEDCYLGRRTYLLPGIPLEAVVSCDQFTPTLAWNDIEEDHLLCRAVSVVCSEASAMVAELPGLFRPGEGAAPARTMLLSLLLAAARTAKGSATQPLAELVATMLVKRAGVRGGNLPLVVDAPLRSQIESLSLFPAAGGEWRSLKELRKPKGVIRLCGPDAQARPGDLVAPLDGMEVAVLRKAFGAKRLQLVAAADGSGAPPERPALLERMRKAAEAPSAETVAQALERASEPPPQKAASPAAAAAPMGQRERTSTPDGAPPEWQELLDAVKLAFLTLRELGEATITDMILDRMSIGSLPGSPPAWHDPVAGTTVINRGNEVVEKIIGKYRSSPVMLLYLVSSTYSAINRAYDRISDEEEMAFQLRLLRLLPPTL